MDDGNCAVSTIGISGAKSAINKFITEQMQPNDKVAIFQTRGGSSLLQQYTSDKTKLLAITKNIRWYPPSGSCGGMGTGDLYEPVRDQNTQRDSSQNEKDEAARERFSNFTQSNQITGAIGVLNYVVKGLYSVSGRKNVILMSDAISYIDYKKDSRQIVNSRFQVMIKETADLANRASVVINTMDIRGIVAQGFSAIDETPLDIKSNINSTDRVLANRRLTDASRHDGLRYLADVTGGKFYKDMNNLEVGIEKLLKVESGYYLLAYQPDDEIFKGKEYHQIEVKLKRSDLVISSRSGFFAITDDKLRPKPKTAEGDLYYALTAPIPNSSLSINISAYYLNTPEKGDLIRAMIYVDGDSLNFSDGEKGNKKVAFDIVAVTLGDKSEIIDDSNKTITIQVPADRVSELKRDGLIYTMDVLVKKEGSYTFRVAMKEKTSNQIGSANQVIEVPNLKKGGLLISGLSIAGVDSEGKMLESEGKDNAFSLVSSPALPAIRHFVRNSIVGYSYIIYNSKLDKNAKKPNLTIQINLYHEGELVAGGSPQTLDISGQSDMGRIKDFGHLRLNKDIPLGNYVLQIIVNDLNTKQTSSQWVDFEVAK